MRCESCGANLPPLTPVCNFCKATTSVGTAQARERAAWEQQQAAQAAHVQHYSQQQREWTLRARAQKLPLWGLVALFIPCLGIPAIAAFVAAWSVRSEAKRSNIPVPGQVTTAFVLSGISFALSAVLVVLFALDSAAQDERLAQLERQATPLLGKAMLNQPEACLLAEYFIERDGHEGTSGLSIDSFRCDGKLFASAPEKLRLEKLHFKLVAEPRDVDVCFQRGARWTLERVVPAGTSCDAPPPEVASAAASTSASASGAASAEEEPARPKGQKPGKLDNSRR